MSQSKSNRWLLRMLIRRRPRVCCVSLCAWRAPGTCPHLPLQLIYAHALPSSRVIFRSQLSLSTEWLCVCVCAARAVLEVSAFESIAKETRFFFFSSLESRGCLQGASCVNIWGKMHLLIFPFTLLLWPYQDVSRRPFVAVFPFFLLRICYMYIYEKALSARLPLPVRTDFFFEVFFGVYCREKESNLYDAWQTPKLLVHMCTIILLVYVVCYLCNVF